MVAGLLLTAPGKSLLVRLGVTASEEQFALAALALAAGSSG